MTCTRALDLFQRHGKLTVFLARLVPGARSLISIPAGVNRMPFGSFIGLTLVGTFLWNILLAGAGYMLGRNWERALELLDRYELILWVTAGVLMLYFFVRKYQQRLIPI
jgi:membrane protein DedA with SNARE-associated domain